MYLRLCEFESLIGRLRYIAALAWPGTAFLREMTHYLTMLKREYVREYQLYPVVVKIPRWLLKDFHWWRYFLSKVQCVPISQLLYEPTRFISMSTDGATNGPAHDPRRWCPGIGIYFEGDWIMDSIPKALLKRFFDPYKNVEKDVHIAHFEMLAVLVGIKSFAERLNVFRDNGDSTPCLMLYCDNTNVVDALTRKRSDDAMMMACVRWICQWMVRNQYRYFVKYVKTKDNVLADALSRYSVEDFKSECERIRLKYRATSTQARYQMDIMKF